MSDKSDPLYRLKAKRGEDLPQSKLTNDDIRLIRGLVEHRDRLKAELKNLTNKAIADKFCVHFRTIDRITSYENWTHI